MPNSAHRVDHHLLEGAHVRHNVALPFAQIEDRVADHLAGAVIGDVAAAVGGLQVDAALLISLLGQKQVVFFALRPSVITCGCSTNSK